jgi:hypothetical protein
MQSGSTAARRRRDETQGGQRRISAVPTFHTVLVKVGTLALCPPYALIFKRDDLQG